MGHGAWGMGHGAWGMEGHALLDQVNEELQLAAQAANKYKEKRFIYRAPKTRVDARSIRQFQLRVVVG